LFFQVDGIAANEQGFVQAWDLKNVRPQPLLIEKQMYKISCKSPTMFVKPELKLIANYSRSLQRPAMLAQNPMLGEDWVNLV
jgi:hypothetical protein